MTLPTFQQWSEMSELPGQGPNATPQGSPMGATGVSAPQHTQDEDSMDIHSLIQKRLNMLLDELEKKKKRPKAELVQIFSSVLQQLMNMGMTKSMANTAVRSVGNGMAGPPGPVPGGPSAAPAQPQVAA